MSIDKIENNDNGDNSDKSTYFVGYLFYKDSKIYKSICKLQLTLKKDFVPRDYPHVTLAYIGNDINKFDTLNKDILLIEQLNMFKNEQCKFRKLDFYGKTLVYVFDFLNTKCNNSMLELMNNSNPDELGSHGDNRLHIAIGKFATNKAKQLFCKNLMYNVTQQIKESYLFTFSFDCFHLVTVNAAKQYTADVL